MQKKNFNTKKLYLRLFEYAKTHWLMFSISILALVVLSATNTGFLATIKMVTDEGFVATDSGKHKLLPLMLIG